MYIGTLYSKVNFWFTCSFRPNNLSQTFGSYQAKHYLTPHSFVHHITLFCPNQININILLYIHRIIVWLSLASFNSLKSTLPLYCIYFHFHKMTHFNKNKVIDCYITIFHKTVHLAKLSKCNCSNKYSAAISGSCSVLENNQC